METTLWNLASVPGWKLDCMLEQAYYQRSEIAITQIKAELERRRQATSQREQDLIDAAR